MKVSVSVETTVTCGEEKHENFSIEQLVDKDQITTVKSSLSPRW